MEMELRSVGNPLNELVLAQSEQVLLRDFFMDEIWKPLAGLKEMPNKPYPDIIGVVAFKDGTMDVYKDCVGVPPSEDYYHSSVVEALQKENEENCRLLGMSAEREIQLLQKVQQLEDQVSCLVQNSESQTQTQQAFIKKLHRLLPDDLCPQDDKSWQQSDAFGRIEYLVAAHKSNRDELKMVWEWVVELKDKLAKTKWQPIETAPRDGTCIRCYVPQLGEMVLHYEEETDEYEECWACGAGTDWDPTHWMPLPEPPTTEETK